MTNDPKLRSDGGRKILLAAVVAAFSAGALAACNTVEGAGQDIENTGEAIEDAADGDS
ncbi:MAG: entericidin A/B family lipoprotein [Kiloniellaceae bacterium]